MMRIYDMLLAHGCVREEPTDAGAAGPRCLTLPLSGLSLTGWFSMRTPYQSPNTNRVVRRGPMRAWLKSQRELSCVMD
jgi:hypothetical protein